INGYAVEQSPEDKLREYYNELIHRRVTLHTPSGYAQGGEITGVNKTLKILRITIDGINA
ncbi:hypothetical protein CHI02_24160, partial [Niallia circulans]